MRCVGGRYSLIYEIVLDIEPKAPSHFPDVFPAHVNPPFRSRIQHVPAASRSSQQSEVHQCRNLRHNICASTHNGVRQYGVEDRKQSLQKEGLWAKQPSQDFSVL